MHFKSYKNWLNENEKQGVVVLFPGGFKPLTAGHLGLIKRYTEHPEVKEVRVLIGPGIRNGIDQKLSLKIAEELLSSFNNVSAEAVPYPSPILTAYKYITDEAEPGVYALAGSKKGGDYERVTNFAEDFSPNGKYASFLNEGVKVIELPIDAEPLIYQGRTDDNDGKPISASIMRKDILNDDYENFITNYPGYNERIIKKIWKMLKRVVIEGTEEETDEIINEYGHTGYGIFNNYRKIDDNNLKPYVRPKTFIIKNLHANGFVEDMEKLENLVKNGTSEYFKGNIIDGMQYVMNYVNNWKNIKTIKWQKKLMSDAQEILDEIWETQQRKRNRKNK